MLVSNRPGKGLEKAWGLFGETTKNSFVEVKNMPVMSLRPTAMHKLLTYKYSKHSAITGPGWAVSNAMFRWYESTNVSTLELLWNQETCGCCFWDNIVSERANNPVQNLFCCTQTVIGSSKIDHPGLFSDVTSGIYCWCFWSSESSSFHTFCVMLSEFIPDVNIAPRSATKCARVRNAIMIE